MRYRLVIVASSMLDAVRHTGGLLFDRVMAGWDVVVLLEDYSNLRPLQILGAETVDLASGLQWQGRGIHPHAVAVAADLFERDSRIRDGFVENLDRGETELTLWGDTPTDIDQRIDVVQHRLSHAARAFKAHALAAAAAPTHVERVETYRSGQLLTCAEHGRADLVPA
ncbi:hypothetical protein [Gordonia rubripertincta]|uniref:Uncharacterized protein n=1 Tax=Gordonia rubripertincta TaxID=36822 RepID=A0ABT4N020_GORRU|nr:hypothetical protein [Gordonia rubripertincta]MCZ4551302.1 hypothetical protein [Gordonia rubripertincta]